MTHHRSVEAFEWVAIKKRSSPFSQKTDFNFRKYIPNLTFNSRLHKKSDTTFHKKIVVKINSKFVAQVLNLSRLTKTMCVRHLCSSQHKHQHRGTHHHLFSQTLKTWLLPSPWDGSDLLFIEGSPRGEELDNTNGERVQINEFVTSSLLTELDKNNCEKFTTNVTVNLLDDNCLLIF